MVRPRAICKWPKQLVVLNFVNSVSQKQDAYSVDYLDYLSKLIVLSLLLLLCSPRYKTLFQPLLEKLRPPSLSSHSNASCDSPQGDLNFASQENAVTCSSETREMAVAASHAVVNTMFCIEEKREGEAEKTPSTCSNNNTLAILFIVIPELTKFRTTNCLGHLHIVRMPLIRLKIGC